MSSLTRFQQIIYDGLLKAEDRNNLTNLFEIMDEVCDKISDEFWVMDYGADNYEHVIEPNNSSISSVKKEDREKWGITQTGL